MCQSVRRTNTKYIIM